MNITGYVFTLKEVSDYLRVPEEKVEKQVLQGRIPGRRIEDEWRFLKSAIDDWLRSTDSRTILLNQTGALSDDDTLEELRLKIYSERGRPETEES
jgi:excisionase family DNA binding protein